MIEDRNPSRMANGYFRVNPIMIRFSIQPSGWQHGPVQLIFIHEPPELPYLRRTPHGTDRQEILLRPLPQYPQQPTQCPGEPNRALREPHPCQKQTDTRTTQPQRTNRSHCSKTAACRLRLPLLHHRQNHPRYRIAILL